MTTVTTMMLNIQLLECISCCTINAAYKCIKNLKIVSTFQSANTTSLQNKHFVDVTTYTPWKCVFLHTDLCKGQRSPRSAPPSWSSRSCSCTWALQPGSRCSSGSACEFSPDRWGTLLWRPQLQRGHKRSLFRYWWPVKRAMSGWHKLSNCLCGGSEILTFSSGLQYSISGLSVEPDGENWTEFVTFIYFLTLGCFSQVQIKSWLVQDCQAALLTSLYFVSLLYN